MISRRNLCQHESFLYFCAIFLKTTSKKNHMGGFFGTVSKTSCVTDLFYGTDYNSHLGTKRGGLATYSEEQGFIRSIHNLQSSYSVPNLRKNWINLKEMPVSVLSVIQTPNLLLLTHISVDLPLLRLLRSQTLKNSKRNYFHKTCISPNLVRVVPIKRNLSLY